MMLQPHMLVTPLRIQVETLLCILKCGHVVHPLRTQVDIYINILRIPNLIYSNNSFEKSSGGAIHNTLTYACESNVSVDTSSKSQCEACTSILPMQLLSIGIHSAFVQAVVT